MTLLIGLLTAVMVVVCLFLILLVLMQLPKKEAGAGLAFGGAATDALFGSGSGNFLTKATKYSVVAFFVLAVGISILQNHQTNRPITQFEQSLKNPLNQPAVPTSPTTVPTAAAAAVTSTNNLTLLPATAISNAAPASPK